MKILILEDDRITGTLLLRILTKFGDCVWVEDGRMAVDFFEEGFRNHHAFDLICMDLILPSMNGQEVLRYLRKVERKESIQRTKVLVITAYGDQKNISRAFRHQCDGYLIKPVEKEKLEKIVQRILGIEEAIGSVEGL